VALERVAFKETAQLMRSPQMPGVLRRERAVPAGWLGPCQLFSISCLSAAMFSGISLRASRRTMSGTRILPMP
jgi:hypothetical protein